MEGKRNYKGKSQVGVRGQEKVRERADVRRMWIGGITREHLGREGERETNEGEAKQEN